MALLANPIGLVVAGIGLAIAAFQEFGDEIDIFGDGMSNLKDVAQAVWDMITETVGEACDWISGLWSDLTGFLDESVGSWQDIFNSVMGFIYAVVSTQINAVINTFATAYMLGKRGLEQCAAVFQ
ncbi:Minor tail protein Gp26 [Bergeriella denitrificans]|uniref:Minor tail protein Gp26 n=2 Tax=Bergeriella denitrificans TaxID=494 RepID=A0A378US05_BERDE|nr:Minor tail protein Gp26 [Bergeriella denitrificans]